MAVLCDVMGLTRFDQLGLCMVSLGHFFYFVYYVFFLIFIAWE